MHAPLPLTRNRSGSLTEALCLVERYVNIKVPEALAKDIDKLVQKKTLGYRSRAEFVIEAIREKLASIKRYEKT